MKGWRTPRENLKRANEVKAAKAERKRELEKRRKQEERRQEQERAERAWEKLVEPPAPRHYYD